MKTTFSTPGERGSAVLVVFVLLSLMVILLMANSRTLSTLNTNLELINRKQLTQVSTYPASTNVPTLTP